jgi:hypothetical protein
MHDVDRVRLESEQAEDEFENEFEDEFEGAEFEDEFGELTEYEYEGPLDEVDEMELAAELLEVGDEAEWEEFLGKLFRRVKKRTGRFLRSRTGRALRRGLRAGARAGLPIAGRAAGAAIGGPVGGMIGGWAAGALGRKLGLELEGLSAEEQEFEVARQLVRFAADAAAEATELQETEMPEEAAKLAVERAAHRHAPGLVRGAAPDNPYKRRRRSGRWVRRGNSIVLLDL